MSTFLDLANRGSLLAQLDDLEHGVGVASLEGPATDTHRIDGHARTPSSPGTVESTYCAECARWYRGHCREHG
jgi:hypothetical protein